MTTSYSALRKAPTTLLICCSQLSYEEWAAEELGLEPLSIMPISVWGGPVALAHSNIAPADWARLRDQTRFFLEEFASIHTVIAVPHEGCGYRSKVLKINSDGREDLPVIAQQLGMFAIGKKIRMFYARPVEPGSVEHIFYET